MTTTIARPATDKQVAFMQRLVAEKQTPSDWTPNFDISSSQASRLIDWLISLPRKATPDQATEPGVYVLDGTVLKVQANRAKTGVYALRWVEIRGERMVDHDESRVHGEWRYEAGLIRAIRPEHRMTLDEAKAFILRYGQCARCGRHLKAADSVERGIGPVCVKYFSF